MYEEFKKYNMNYLFFIKQTLINRHNDRTRMLELIKKM